MNMFSVTVRRAFFVTMLAMTLGFARTAHADSFVLSWDYNPEPEVNGYIVSIGTAPGEYSRTIDVGHVNQYVFGEAVAGQRYYFVVAAYAGQLVSPRSSEISGISNSYPVFTAPANQTVGKGVSVNLSLTATDAEGDVLTFSATGLPPGLMLDQRLGLITGVPTTTGSYTTVVSVSDGKLTAGGTFVWTVTNTRPTLTTPASQTTAVNAAAVLQLVGADVNNDVLTYGATGLPAGLAITPSTGRIAGTPTTAGTYTVTVSVTDGVNTARTASFTWTVTAPANTAPTLSAPGNQSGTVGQTVALTLQAADANGDALTFSASGLPAGVQLSTAGKITGAPTTAGTYTVVVSVSDGKAMTSQSFTWTVTTPVVAPTQLPGSLQFSAATYSVAENGGQATITITRLGGSTGAISAVFATSNGTATAGSDYTAKTQTVTLANGVTTATVTVAILNDTTAESAETVNLSLTGPTGGATLGSPATAVLTINDDDSVSGPSVNVSPATVVRGNAVTVTWSNIAKATNVDWIGFYAAGASNASHIDWVYVNCSQEPTTAKASGSCSIPVPATLTPGSYEMRVLANDGFTSVATSNVLTVTTPVVAGPKVTLSTSTVVRGTPVTATWSGISGASSTDWLGLYAAGADNGSFVDWVYVSCSQSPSAAKASGSCSVAIPASLAPGSYEVRLLANDGFTSVATSTPLAVTMPAGPTVSVTASVAAGSAVTVTWSGIASPSATDWFALYARGADITQYLDWAFVSCSKNPSSAAAAKSCSFTVPSTIAAGTYELRLLADNGYTQLAISNALTVK